MAYYVMTDIKILGWKAQHQPLARVCFAVPVREVIDCFKKEITALKMKYLCVVSSVNPSNSKNPQPAHPCVFWE